MVKKTREELGKRVFGSAHRKWKDSVLGRDKNTCQLCGHHTRTGKGLCAHHIIPVSEGGAEYDTKNGVTLCDGKGSCHQKVHQNIEEYTPELIDLVDSKTEEAGLTIDHSEMQKWVEDRMIDYKQRQLRGLSIGPAQESLLMSLCQEEFVAKKLNELRLGDITNRAYSEQIIKVNNQIINLMKALGIEPSATNDDDEQFNNLASLSIKFDELVETWGEKGKELEEEEEKEEEALKGRLEDYLL